MSDFVIVDLAAHLAASKNIHYRHATLETFRTLARFLDANGLSVRPLTSDGEMEPSFRLMHSDLTGEGFALIQAALHRWVRSINAGKVAPSDARPLSRALLKLKRQAQ